MNVQFWILFLFLNSCYFWPRYVLNKESSHFLPFADWFEISSHRRLRSLLIRKNYDVFRVSVDFLVLILAYPLFLDNYLSPAEWAKPVYVYFGLSLAYQVYYTAFDRIYHVTPVLFNDWFMIKMAFRLFFIEYDRKNLAVTLGAILFAVLAWFLVNRIISLSAFLDVGVVGIVAMSIVFVAGVYSLYKYESKQFPQLVFQSQLQSFIRNIIASLRAKREVSSLTLAKMKEYNIDSRIQLQRRPNIYFIVVESYGRVILDEPRFQDEYMQYTGQLQEALTNAGWHIRSNLSLSPVTAGASWISYTSMLYGLNVKGQGLYLTLFKNPYIDQYDSLFNWLRRQGYFTCRLSSLGGYEKMTIPYDTYSRLYGIDKWILHRDLNYEGPEYGFGPSPPDQYALHFAHDALKKETSGPYALFYITQNSHTPFESPTEVAENWKDLRISGYISTERSKFWKRPDFARYGNAIKYQLSFLTDFIVKNGGDNDLFILVGDHQPASLSIDIRNYETPVHVLSKDAGLVDRFLEYGFSDGLVPNINGMPIRQEALHWSIVRSIVKSYADSPELVPAFLEKGIPTHKP